ncbi:MAG: 16S rRNA processing protein RimM [Anaerolineae bacterium]|nr:16S rRNA processing protein RimM [Anaerolineae bacterium]
MIRPHGVHGELRIEVITGYPERFGVYKQVFVGDAHVPFKIKAHRFHKNCVLLTLDSIDSRTLAEPLRDQWLWISIDDAIPLQEGEYYVHQVLDMQVITVDGEALGRITEIIETGANDVYVVQGARGEILLPAIPDVIVRVDVPGRQMTVHLLEGLV